MRSHKSPYKYQHLRHLKLVMMDTDYYQLPSRAGQKLFRIWLPGNFNKSCFVTDNSYTEKHDFFPLVWFSFQIPFTFYSSGVFNSFLSCCLSCGVSSSSVSCLLIGIWSFSPLCLPCPLSHHWSFGKLSSHLLFFYHCKSCTSLLSSLLVFQRKE